ncbi:hypothetical protein Goklo_021481 [Gossypium klotzschianum]|uniref:CCHC-type domain-containing protein n=1 Tax=Gossypium klotzschianum TaxID=34286 RepID=A0A7J8UW83_9ROSI|nr:hypothetical protein [Gossypium klotzschianum]
MEDDLANLRLVDEEEDAIQKDAAAVDSISQFFLVGRCLTDSVVHFPSLQNTMADIWHPIGGICITDLGEKRYLFQFFNEVDIARVLAGTPWFFNNHLLILKRITYGENPATLELNSTVFWVQVHDLPLELMSEQLAKQLGNFCGGFIGYDSATLTSGSKKYMRVRYEKLSLFCFICGKLGHGESFCPLRLRIEPSKIVFGWDLSLRAVVGRRNLEGEEGLTINGFGKGPMDRVLEEENDVVAMVEGKKRQRVVEEPVDFLGSEEGSRSKYLSASSGDQSSRDQ